MRRRLPFLVMVLLLVALGLLLYVGAFELPSEVAKTTHVFFNYGEAAVWGIAGIYVFWRSRKQHSAARILGRVASMAFLAFGVSDLIETRTGTWYDPWWLFAWKAICVLILLSCLGVYARHTRRGATP
jgi:hypothetical protein